MNLQIQIDALNSPEIKALLTEHLLDMHATSPPESVHALSLEHLQKPDITFWSAWEANQLAGCGAIRELDVAHGEIKSMRTTHNFRRKGVGLLLLQHIISIAQERGYKRLSLETGSEDYFKPARALYSRFGFIVCEPFAEYSVDPNSVFMTLELKS